jgi:hypothetical protein
MARLHNDPRKNFLERAAQCRLKADEAICEAARHRYLDSAERWAALATSYEPVPSLVPEIEQDFGPVTAAATRNLWRS